MASNTLGDTKQQAQKAGREEKETNPKVTVSSRDDGRELQQEKSWQTIS